MPKEQTGVAKPTCMCVSKDNLLNILKIYTDYSTSILGGGEVEGMLMISRVAADVAFLQLLSGV